MNIFKKIFGRKRGSSLMSQTEQKFNNPDFDEYDEFEDINSFFGYVLNSDFEVAYEAAKAIHRLFNTVTLFKNKHLYEVFRYLKIKKADVQRFDRFDLEINITLLCIASLNGNGYAREAALDRLGEIKTQKTIPFILFRLADWVVPIRKKAEVFFESFVTQENVLYFIQNYKLINWLLQVKRTDLSGLVDTITDLLTSNQLSQGDIDQLLDGERFLYFMAFAKQKKLNNDLVSLMLNDKYYLIRILVIKNLDVAQDVRSILSTLLKDKFQKVRQGAVKQIYNRNIEEYKEFLLELIFDVSPSVRYDSRRLLDKISKLDYKKLYDNELKRNTNIVGSILGLSEVSDKSDIETVKPFLESDRVRVKSAALYGIYNLSPDLASDIAYSVIGDNSPVNTKKVAEFILSRQGVDYSILRRLYDTTDATGKKVILRLFNRFSGWSVAGDFLKTLTENDETLSLMARTFLEQWNLYTISLATNQKPEDKDYVLTWYYRAEEMRLQPPSNIPFIFGER